MKNYCHVENKQIVSGPQPLPVNWKHVSNFNLLTEEELINYGWFVYERITKPELSITNTIKKLFKGESSESKQKTINVSSTIEITNNKVIEIVKTRELTAEELETETEEISRLNWLNVRGERNRLLVESDYFMLIDKWEQLTNDQKQNIKNYRQLLRDLPQNSKEPSEIIWPVMKI